MECVIRDASKDERGVQGCSQIGFAYEQQHSIR
jgi:hypothetical protein